MRTTGTLFPNAKRTIILASAGAGKGLPVTSRILTRNGFVQLKDLRLYDKVISPVDGKEYPVTGIYNRGYRHVNRITFTNRTSVLFDDDHLWAIQSDVDRLNGSGFTVVNANELKSLPLKRKAGKWNKHLVFVPVSCPVEFSDKILPVPYALGLFISDGCFTNKSIVLAEEDVKQKFENEIGTCGSYLKPLKKKYNYYISKFSSFKTILPSFGTHSYNKFIPKEYLYSSLDTRRKLLSGLIDGDGMVTRSGKIEFVSTSKQLIDDITFLVSSLGGVVAKGKEKVGKYTKNGSVVLCRKAYRISFWLPEGVLLSAKHQTRLSLCTKQRHPYKAVESIEEAGYDECMCIYIDSPDHLFITDDWIVTHNTSRLMSILGEYLVTMDSSRISFVTFTRKGVAEGVSRVLQKYTFLTYEQLPFFRTLHSLCFKELKLDYKNLWGIRHEKLLNASIGSNVHRFYDDEHSTRDNQILDAYDIERSGGRADPYITCSPEYARLVSAYERVKEETGAIDFTDCLKLFVEKGKPLPVDVACVDECFSPETKVRMYDGGIKEIKDIKIGDKVQGTKGAVTVIAKQEGVDEMYNVVTAKNKVLFTCNSQHLLQTASTGNWKKTQSLKKTKVVFQQYKGEEKSFSLDPYFFGLWLGNGFSREAVVVCNNKDIDTISWLKTYGELLGDKVTLRNRKGIVQVEYSVKVKGRAVKCEIRKRLESLGFLLSKTKKNVNRHYTEKHIPNDYLTSSVEQRLRLLAGIIDSDGMFVSAGKNKKFRIEMARKKLMQDIYNLAASLGFNPTWYVTHHITNKIRREYYRVDFFGDRTIPTLLKRKQSSVDKAQQCVIGRVEFTKKSEYIGITVDAPDNLFVLANGCVVHNCQDLTDLQWDVCNIAFANASKVYCAGDDFQSVFTYAGANPQVLIDLARVSKVEKLEISHRLPVTVYNLARKITNNIEVKIDKDCRPKEGAKNGAVKFLPDLFSLYPFIKGKAEEDWYILTRNTAFQKDVISFLEGLVLPYIANDRYFIPALDWRKLKDFYLFKKEGYKTEEKKLSFMQENGIKNINCPLIETTLFSPAKNTLYQAYVDMYGWEKIEEWYEKKTGIIVSNIHRVKGGEADNVVVVLDCGKKVAEHAFDMPDDELRTLYVAVTRAKENLFFIRSQSNDALDKLLTRCINS